MRLIKLILPLLFLASSCVINPVVDQQEIRIHRERYLFKKTSARSPLPFEIYKDGEDLPYIPVHARLSNGEKADGVAFVNEHPVSSDEVLRTELFTSEALRRKKIFGKEYFYPFTSTRDYEKGKLDFYLIPRDKATLEDNILLNEDRVYRPVKD